MKSLFVIVVILGSFRSNEPASRAYVVKNLQTNVIDTIVWQSGHLKLKDTVGIEFESYQQARYGKNNFYSNH